MSDEIEAKAEPPASVATGTVGEAKVVKTKAALTWFGAICRSLVNWTVDFYPRLSRGTKVVSLKSPAIVAEMAEATKHWQALAMDRDAFKDAIALAKASLDEAKEQTEYQDQKATRLLTVTTFLSALSGALFASFTAAYPLAMVKSTAGCWQWVLIAAYVAFLLFVLSALSGALVTFHATRTRFKYPETATAKKQAGPARSHLFFREMIGVSPQGWAESFVSEGADGKPELSGTLKATYLQNYVGEAYLVAAKTADKLRYLQPAQSLLAWSLRFLLAFVVLLAVISANVDPQPPKPVTVALAPPGAPIPVDAHIVAPPRAEATAPGSGTETQRKPGKGTAQ